jgi:hypothetical protein
MLGKLIRLKANIAIGSDGEYINKDLMQMGNYSEIKGKCASRKRYADGGRVSTTKKGGKTVINIITAPAPAAAPPAPAPVPPPPMAPAGPPMPPQAGPAALKALGAGGPPAMGQFKRGGRVKAGAASGEGRLRNAAKQKRK